MGVGDSFDSFICQLLGQFWSINILVVCKYLCCKYCYCHNRCNAACDHLYQIAIIDDPHATILLLMVDMDIILTLGVSYRKLKQNMTFIN